ncbi:MAG: hypothetical protein JHC95_17600, partial [Solirubrobacteraceae bacterium]|nr:hypothetical protein [Solirubrobacteraceae bacterium]
TDVFRARGRTAVLGRDKPDATLGRYFTIDYGLKKTDVTLKPLVKGQAVIAGTILGRVGRPAEGGKPRFLFEIRPSGTDAPRIDPKPILDGWRLLASTDVFRARGRTAVLGRDKPRNSTVGEILLMDKQMLQERVLSNARIEIYACGRRDIQAGNVDRRVLATLEFLAQNDLRPTVTSLRCGHGTYTTSGNVSEHTTGTAVDIAAINGIPMLGHQGEGSITDVAVRRLLTLQGTMKPHQIITLMQYEGTDNTLAMPDHNDHIHVGWHPSGGGGTARPGAGEIEARLRPSQWRRLLRRMGRIGNPAIPTSSDARERGKL